MKFITIATWEPHQRDELVKRRKETGRMLPEGIKIIGEGWMHQVVEQYLCTRLIQPWKASSGLTIGMTSIN